MCMPALKMLRLKTRCRVKINKHNNGTIRVTNPSNSICPTHSGAQSGGLAGGAARQAAADRARVPRQEEPARAVPGPGPPRHRPARARGSAQRARRRPGKQLRPPRRLDRQRRAAALRAQEASGRGQGMITLIHCLLLFLIGTSVVNA